MAASDSFEKMREHLTCCICFEMFKEPKTLHCMHTFCETCLDKFVAVQLNKSVIRCPTCRESVYIPKRGVSSMRTNFALQNMVDDLEGSTPKLSRSPKPPNCSSCLETENKSIKAVAFCPECNEHLCTECQQAHSRVKVTRDHMLQPIKTGKPKPVLPAKPKAATPKPEKQPVSSKCTVHKEYDVRGFCITCSASLCILCLTELASFSSSKHAGHSVKSIKEATGIVIDSLQNELSKLESITEDASDGIGAINDWVVTLAISKLNISIDIQETANHMKGLIDNWAEMMEKRTVQLAEEQRNQVQVKLDSITSEMKRLKAGHQSARDKLRVAMESENVLYKSSEISGQISQLCDSATYDSSQLPRPVRFSLTVVPDDTTEVRLNHFLGDVTCGGGGLIVAESTSSLLSESSLAEAAITTVGTKTVCSFRPVKGEMSGMCFTRGNEFFAVDREEKVVWHYSVGKNYRFNPKGNFGKDILKDPIDIVQHPDNRILVTDGNIGHAIKALSFESGTWQRCGNIAHAKLKKAVGIAVAPDGKLYVSDVDSQCVMRIEAEHGDKFQVDMTVQKFKGKNQFDNPQFLAVSQKSGNWVVSDRSACQIKMFSSTGKFLWRYGGFGNSARKLNKPAGICMDCEDRIYVADVLNKRVHVLSGEGQLIAHIPFKVLGNFLPFPDMLDITPKGDLALGNRKGMLKILQLKF